MVEQELVDVLGFAIDMKEFFTPLLVFLLAFVLWPHQQLNLGINPSCV